MKEILVLLSLALSTVALAASPDAKAVTLKNYKQAMRQAADELRNLPEYPQLSKELRRSGDLLVKKADEMLPAETKAVPEIWSHVPQLKKHPDYAEFAALQRKFAEASENRIAFFYTHSAEFKKATDEFRAAWNKPKFVPNKTKPAPQTVVPTFGDVKYGAHGKELMNFWQFESEKPVGVLLHIHGGGWMGGKKMETEKPHNLKQGYHLASISYPLVNEGAVQPAMLNSALRAVQFLRYQAKDWNIDPERIVVTGGSAGGCSSLLVALHDDVANPESDDPVERFSSRVAGAAVAGAQTTMNPFVIKERIGEKTFGNPMPYKPFGAESIEELMENWDKHKELVLKCSPVTHLSADDPPLHLFYNVNREFPTTKASNGIHSPIFGEIMLEACKEIGVECHLQYWEKDRPKPAVSRQQFLDRLLLNLGTGGALR